MTTANVKALRTAGINSGDVTDGTNIKAALEDLRLSGEPAPHDIIQMTVVYINRLLKELGH